MHHQRGRTSYYRPLSYPFISLLQGHQAILFLLGEKFENVYATPRELESLLTGIKNVKC